MDNNKWVLYFEDDSAIAELVMSSLGKLGYTFYHFTAFPDEGMQAIKQRCEQHIDLVILDINMPGKSGYEVCELLKQQFIPAYVPVLFVSGLMDDDDIMHAFSVGADDYLVKPIRLNELQLKIPKLITQKREQFDAAEQASAALKMAFDAMKNSSELGDILRFYEAVHQAESYDALTQLVFEAVRGFELESTIVLVHEETPLYYRDDMQRTPLELESIMAARSRARLYSWKAYSFFSYDLFTVLIRNMPLDDEERYGILKDQICLLLNGVDARIKSMMLASSENEKQQRIGSITKVLANLVLEMEQQNTVFSTELEQVIQDMEANIISEIAQFSLLDNEESALITVLNESINTATRLFDQNIENEKQRRTIMNNLITKLNQ